MGQHHEIHQQSFPWKWFSTENVTVPPCFLHTIVSWVCALPLGLQPLPPHSRGSRSGLVLFVNSSESSLPSHAWKRFGVHCSELASQPPSALTKAKWDRHLPTEASGCFCFFKSQPKSLFISLEDSSHSEAESDLENCIFLRQVTCSKSPHWCKQRAKAGREEWSWGFS